MLFEAPPPSRRVLLGVALVCFANLLLEVVLTRIFSAMMYYHFTFLAISVALLGLGASGVYVYIHADRYSAENLESELARNARRFAGAALLALAYLVANPVATTVRAGNVSLENYILLRLILLIVVTVLPFFYAGMVVSLGITAYRQSVNRIYAYDLFGAACAALLAGLVLRAVGGPSAVALAAVIASGAVVLFAGRGRARWLPLLGTALLFLASTTTSLFALPPLKAEAGKLEFEAWNAFSRVTVHDRPGGVLDIQMDAAAATHIFSLASAPPWRTAVSALGFALHEGKAPEVLIIGPGGGLDVAHALQAGARRVTAVDINPLIIHTVMSERFVEESGGLYQDPRVDLVVGEGRSFVRRSDQRFDVIQASLVDTWAATSAGAFALTENNLYTLEAFEDYYSHLTAGGVFAMCRYFTGQNPETVRLVVLAAAALEHRGVPVGRARNHLYLATQRNLAIMLAKGVLAFTPAELDRLDAIAQRSGFTTVLSPRTPGDSEIERLVDAGADSEAVRRYAANITPPTDDRPFFFYFGRADDLLNLPKHLSQRRMMNPALWVLGAITLTVMTLVAVFVFVPLIMYRMSDLRGGGRADHVRRGLGLGYFALIGLAFMVVEIGLIQKLVLFLGHPTHAFITVLVAMLVGSASGALLAEKRAKADPGRLVLWAGAVLAVAVIVAAFASSALREAIVWPFAARVGVTLAGAGALGVMMGVMLPTGVRILSLRDSQIIPWAWGVNGGMSVVATVAATVASIHLGFTPTLLGGAALYALAGALGWRVAALATGAPVPSEAAAAPEAGCGGGGATPNRQVGAARCPRSTACDRRGTRAGGVTVKARERALVVLLRVSGGVLLLAFFAILLPTEWMARTHRWLGLGPFPASPLVDYLTRSASALYGIHGGLLLVLSRDVRRFGPVVAYVAWSGIAFGAAMIAIDIGADMPLYWILGEGPTILLAGLATLWLVRGVQDPPGEGP